MAVATLVILDYFGSRTGEVAASTMAMTAFGLLLVAMGLSARSETRTIFDRDVMSGRQQLLLYGLSLLLIVLGSELGVLQRVLGTTIAHRRPMADLPRRGRRAAGDRRGHQALPASPGRSLGDRSPGRTRMTHVGHDPDAALRSDVRRVAGLLGESLVRQEGAALLDLVEELRMLTRSDPSRAADLLRGVDEAVAARLVRAFNAYFHLANVVEQVHRGRELRRRRAADGGWLDRTARLHRTTARSATTSSPRPPPAWRCGRSSPRTRPRRPGARRSPSSGPWPSCSTPRPPKPRSHPGPTSRRGPTGRLAEVIDLLWLTDELRRERPEPIDEARNAVFHLEDAARSRRPRRCSPTWPPCSPASASSSQSPPRPCGSAPGPAATGTATPTSRPRSRCNVLTLQHEQGIRGVERALTELVEELSVSSRVGGVSSELLESLAADLDRLPEVDPRFRRINAEEPYRLKITCIRAKLARTRARIAAGPLGRHEPGADYLGAAGLLDDLEVLRRSLARAPRASWWPRDGSPISSARSAPWACTWRRWTCASTPTPTTWRWPRSSIPSARPSGPTPSSTRAERTAWLVARARGPPAPRRRLPLADRPGRRGVRAVQAPSGGHSSASGPT